MAAEVVSYSVKLPARTLRSLPASSSDGTSQWVVGTTCLREENEVRVLQYDAAHDQIKSVASWVHPQEVWDIACCPGHPRTLITVHSTGGCYGATVWQTEDSSAQLLPAANLSHEGTIRRALWGGADSSNVVTVADTALKLWDMGTGSAQQVCSIDADGGLGSFWTAALQAQNPTQALVARGNNVQLWDMSRMTSTAAVHIAHRLQVRDVSWAPGSNHCFITGADDGKVRCWDVRLLNNERPLLELSGHTHWVWQVAFSPFHDSLLLSSSTDTTVCVWYTPTLTQSSTDSKPAVASRSTSRQEGFTSKPHKFDDHEDSVYGLAWSSVDPWLFASMSYDGRFLVNKVPKNIKYKILI